MGAFAETEKPRLVDSGMAAPDFWVDGVGKIEKLGGGVFRIILYRIKRPLEDDDGPIVHEISGTILTNLKHLNSTLMLLRALAENLSETAIGMLLN